MAKNIAAIRLPPELFDGGRSKPVGGACRMSYHAPDGRLDRMTSSGWRKIPYEVERLKATISSGRHQPAAALLQTIMASAARHSGSEKMRDDCTVVVVKALADTRAAKDVE
jgi:hypothetical protein